MASAVEEFEKLVHQYCSMQDTTSGQMFGKACMKVHGKAFVSQHQDWVVFKLSGEHHRLALEVDGAVLWDPSGKGRPMKEWVALPALAHPHFAVLARASYDYVAAGA